MVAQGCFSLREGIITLLSEAATMKGLEWKAQNREPQEYSRHIFGIYVPSPFIPLIYSYYILGISCLGFPLKPLYTNTPLV